MATTSSSERIVGAAALLAAYAAGRRNFVFADLRGADLRGADLGGANLRGADLRGADLGGANLRDATLRDATLRDADLEPIRLDIEAVLAQAPGEAQGVLDMLRAGRIDGSVYTPHAYSQGCACLVGSIALLRHEAPEQLDVTCGIPMDSDRPAERWFLALRPGDTPETSMVAAITAEWIEAWLARQASAQRTPDGQKGADDGEE